MPEQSLAYPLTWPHGRPRTPIGRRTRAPFSREPNHAPTVATATRQLELELGRLGVRKFIVSSNVELRLDGFPRSGKSEPHDSGVAVYFQLGKRETVLACDKWDRVADNLRAIVKHIDALRGQERWGVGSIEQAFAGYAALPAPGQHARRSWRQVFGVPDGYVLDRQAINIAYRNLAALRHPDAGGTADEFAELTAARDEALQEIAR